MNQPSDPNPPIDLNKPAPGGPPPAAPPLVGAGSPPAAYGMPPAPMPASGSPFPPGVMMASAGRRIGGFFMEFLLAVVTLGIGYLIWTLIVWARGQTPGKQVLKMRCYRVADQRSAHWGWMFLRQFVAGVIYQVSAGVLFLVSAIMLVARQDRRTIPDFIAGTVVLYDPDGAMR
jgi:uncharacterized RDD family membrane protein YckC